MTYAPSIKADVISYAQKSGLRAASRKYGVSVTSVKKWVDEAKPVDSFEAGVSLAVVEAEVVDADTIVEGLPPGTTAGYIDPANVTRLRGLAHLYADRRRAELRIKLADAAVDLAQKVRDAGDGREAMGFAKALGEVVDRLRLESGQVTDLRGHVELRGSLDERQTEQLSTTLAGPDLTVPIEANVFENVDDD